MCIIPCGSQMVHWGRTSCCLVERLPCKVPDVDSRCTWGVGWGSTVDTASRWLWWALSTKSAVPRSESLSLIYTSRITCGEVVAVAKGKKARKWGQKDNFLNLNQTLIVSYQVVSSSSSLSSHSFHSQTYTLETISGPTIQQYFSASGATYSHQLAMCVAQSIDSIIATVSATSASAQLPQFYLYIIYSSITRTAGTSDFISVVQCTLSYEPGVLFALGYSTLQVTYWARR